MRRTLIFVAVLLAALAGGYALYWRSAAHTLADGIERWAADQRKAGYEVAYATPEIDGFPLRLDARIAAPQIAAPPGELPWRWSGPTLLLHARPWAPLDAEASVPGRHDIEIGSGDDVRRYVVDAATAVGNASFGLDGELTEAAATLGDLLITEDGSEDRTLLAETAGIQVQRGESDDHRKPSVAFQLALAGVVLPPDAMTPLGRDVEKLEVDGAVLGGIPEHSETLRDALGRWRDDGGTLELERVVAYWGPLEFTGSATFALDAALQPVGAMSATIAGHEATIDALVDAGTVTVRDGSLAKIVLTALSKPSPVDGQPELTAPVSLQDGHLWIGPAKLAAVPRIEWP